ncbi:MAG: hypothetical protein Q4G16_05645 [Cruoricaptor ignavus]|nr:hypothetical protein [Cruoricaptor ignavus]
MKVKLKIAYIELDTHAEIAANIIDLLSESDEVSVDYYFNEKIFNQLQINENQYFIKSNSKNILEQLNSKSYDLVVIGTVHRYFNTFYKITERYKTAIITHNLNFAGISAFRLFGNIFQSETIYRLKLLLKEGLLLKNKVYANAEKFLVLDQNLAKSPYHYFPIFYTKEKVNDIKTESQKTIVIPGEVSQKRRNYHKVFEVLKIFNSQLENQENIEFVFLGKASGFELDELKYIDNQLNKIKIRYFSEKVPQREFDEIMSRADLLWCPLRSEIEFFSNREIYGETKMSGNIGDAIKFGKMAIFPKNYRSEYPFVITEPEEVSELIQLFTVKNLPEFQSSFSKENQSVALCKVFREI